MTAYVDMTDDQLHDEVRALVNALRMPFGVDRLACALSLQAIKAELDRRDHLAKGEGRGAGGE